MIIGIIGNGFVGKATQLLYNSKINMLVYDIIPELCNPPGLTLEDLKKCDIIFIALPTPMANNGSCYTQIIDNVVSQLNNIIDKNRTSIVLRSTVPPGTSKKLDVYFMPEFLTEKNWENDFVNCKHWIFGYNGNNTEYDNLFIQKITKLFDMAYLEGKIKYNNYHFISSDEAELVKYTRNCFLALKVSFFNEIAQYAELKKINYLNVRDLVILDERIGTSHTLIGVDGKKGYGGTCFPKDTNALKYDMEQSGMKSYIIDASIKRNELIDRPEKDWNTNKGRAVIE